MYHRCLSPCAKSLTSKLQLDIIYVTDLRMQLKKTALLGTGHEVKGGGAGEVLFFRFKVPQFEV
jgi:hypothetical protein